jgi:hypothetical protein
VTCGAARTARSRLGHLALLAVTFLALGVPLPQVAHGQDTALRRTQLTVVAIDTVVGAGVATDAVRWRMLVENRTDEVWADVRVQADLHAPLGSSSALSAALAGGTVPSLLRRVSIEASPLGLDPGGIALVEGELTLTGLTIGGGVADVLPVRLSVLADGVEVGRLDTAVLHLATLTPVPLRASVVWPVATAPTRAADGTVGAALDPLMLPGGRLDTLVRGLSSPGVTFVTIAPGVTLLEDLELRALEGGDGPGVLHAAALQEQFIAAIRQSQSGPIALPYADADISRILASPPAVQRLAAAAVFEGSRRLAGLTARSAGPVTLLEHPSDPRVLDLVAGSIVLLSYESIDGPALAFDLSPPDAVRTLVAPSGRLLAGVVADPFVTAAIGDGARERFATPGAPLPLEADREAAPAQGGPVLAAHHVLVRTAMHYAEAPNRTGRSLLVLPPPGLDPDPRFLTALLDGLAAAPWLALQGPVSLVASASPDASPEPIALRDPLADPLPPRLVQAIAQLAAARELLLDANDPAAAGGELDELTIAGRDLGGIADELMRATARTTPSRSESDAGEVAARLEAIGTALRESLGALVVTGTEVTLTARDGVLPLTLRHAGGVPLRLVVEVTGPAALAWPDGTQRRLTLAADEERTLEIPVRVGSTGTFPVVVRVSTPDGTLLAEETLSVRATALAGPALAGIGTVVAVLLVIGTSRQRRRSRRAHPSSAA